MRIGWLMALAGLLIPTTTSGNAQQSPRRSDSVVKAGATASRPDVHGVQVISIDLEIEKGWWIYANPVNHDKEFLDPARTKVVIKTKMKSLSSVKYPGGRTLKDEFDRFDVFEGKLKIEATVKRAAGDTGPLDIEIHVNAFNRSLLLVPGVVRLTVPEPTK